MKLLDPSFLEVREKLLPLATRFLHACFKTYPFIDYHAEKQKYAIANDHGPIVVYDLKTGTKCFLLESSLPSRASVVSLAPDMGHLCALSGVIHSKIPPDTRAVLVWRLSSNILSIFSTSFFRPCMEYSFQLAGGNIGNQANAEILQLVAKDDRLIRPYFFLEEWPFVHIDVASIPWKERWRPVPALVNMVCMYWVGLLV